MTVSSFCWISRRTRGGSIPGKFRSTCSSTISTSARSSASDRSVFISGPSVLCWFREVIMKIKKSPFTLMAVLAAIAATVVPAPAQHFGFRIGIAPAINQPTVNPYVIPSFSPWMAAFVAPPTPFWSPATQVLLPSTQVPFPPTVLPFPSTFPVIQAPLVVTRPPFQQHSGIVVSPGAVVVNVPPVPQAYFGLPVPHVIPIGTPRAQVLAQLGQPSVTVVTSTGETLYFPGGATVIIQNGQVITGPR